MRHFHAMDTKMLHNQETLHTIRRSRRCIGKLCMIRYCGVIYIQREYVCMYACFLGELTIDASDGTKQANTPPPCIRAPRTQLQKALISSQSLRILGWEGY